MKQCVFFVLFLMLFASCRNSDLIVSPPPPSGSITFPSGTSPGFMETVNNSKAYTANYSGTVSLIDLYSDSVITTSGHLVAFPGGIVAASGKVYVSDFGLYPNLHNMIIVLDGTTLAVIDTIHVGIGAGMMAKNSAGSVYIVCAGSYPAPGTVYAINTVTDAVTDSVAVNVGPSDIAVLNQSLYVLHGDHVMKLSTSPLSVADTSFITLSNGLYFYALNADESAGNLYVSKIISSGGSGEVEIHDSTGVLVRPSFAVGLFPGAFAFKQSSGKGTFIINEGAYPNAGTLSFYSATKDSVFQSIVGISAGWITPNDAKVVGTRLYVVVNGNDKIEILNADEFQ